jgi:SAM-dependent methyltransferase
MNRLDRLSHKWLAQRINNQSVARILPFVSGRVVDLGCGSCPYKPDLLAHATRYVAVDWPGTAHDRGCVDVFADLCAPLPFADAWADTVVSFQVMEHLPEPGRFLAECNRILRPGAYLLLTVPFMWHVHEAPHDYFRYTRFGLEYLLRKAGFVDVEVTEDTGFWQMWLLKFTYYTRRAAPGPLRYLWAPLWWLLQSIAPLLDRLDWHPGETAGYTVVARSPLPADVRAKAPA